MITSRQIIEEYLKGINVALYKILESEDDGRHVIFLAVSKHAGPGIKHLIGRRNINMQHLKGFLSMYGHAVEGRKNFLILKLENEKV
jgi:hypothetical protein